MEWQFAEALEKKSARGLVSLTMKHSGLWEIES